MLKRIGRWSEETLDRLPGGAEKQVGCKPGRVRGAGFLVVLRDRLVGVVGLFRQIVSSTSCRRQVTDIDYYLARYLVHFIGCCISNYIGMNLIIKLFISRWNKPISSSA